MNLMIIARPAEYVWLAGPLFHSQDTENLPKSQYSYNFE